MVTLFEDMLEKCFSVMSYQNKAVLNYLVKPNKPIIYLYDLDDIEERFMIDLRVGRTAELL